MLSHRKTCIYLLAVTAVMMWLTASKKKNCEACEPQSKHMPEMHTFEPVEVLTSMTTLAVVTARKEVMFMALIALRMM